jgi:tetratricopeptide (TPR) repeat protein
MGCEAVTERFSLAAGVAVAASHQVIVRGEESPGRDPAPRESGDLPKIESWTPVAKLTPLEAGPGVIVCEPSAVSLPPAMAEFGSACARWLHLAMAGRSEFGQTPALGAIDRARRQLKKSDLCLTVEEAGRAARMTGASHVATGELKPSDGGLSLTYRVHHLRLGEPIGTANTTGTPEQILAALPEIAGKLAAALEGRPGEARVPPAPAVSVEDFALFGRVPWFPERPVSGTDAKRLAELAAVEPLAGLLYLSSGSIPNARVRTHAADRLLQQAPDNQVVIGHMLWIGARPSAAGIARLRRTIAANPTSYQMAHAETWLNRTSGQPDAERMSAERAVRAAPHSPDAWLALGYTTSGVASRLRRGRFVADLSDEEMVFVSGVYADWLNAVRKATELDPQFGKAWHRVATAATFAGDRALAEKAFWKAHELYEEARQDVYWWGLQMFHAKWGGRPADLKRVAGLAVAEPYASPSAALKVVGGLSSAGLEAEADALLDRVTRECREAVRRTPEDAQAHYNLGCVLWAGKELDGAAAAFRELVRLNPGDAEAHFELGRVLDARRRTGDAIHEYRETLRLDPEHSGAHHYLAWGLKEQGEYDAAEREVREALRRNPEIAEAHYLLGQLCLRKRARAQATRAMRNAVKLKPYFREALRDLSALLTEQGEHEEAIGLAERLVTVTPDDFNANYALGYAYAMKGDLKACVRQARICLSLDPKHLYARQMLGEALFTSGEKDAGRRELEAVIAAGPGPAADEARRVLAGTR